jgi:hypothetical protein
MTKARLAAVALALPLALTTHTARAEVSTMTMMSLCGPALEAEVQPDGATRMIHTYESGLCFGAFLSVQSMSFVMDGNGAPAFHACLPTQPIAHGVVQMVRVFDAYARKHPEKQNESYITKTLNSLIEAFPCKEPSTSRK